MPEIAIGRLLRAGTSGFMIGCNVNQIDVPAFGSLVRVPLGPDYDVYGLIHDTHIDDDGIVRQLATASEIAESIIQDNRQNRNVPVEMSVMSVGYRQGRVIRHLLPPRPPLSLEFIYLCQPDEVCAFTSSGSFGYLRHILRAVDLPIGELIAAHIEQAQAAHRQCGDPAWVDRATQELIVLLRDDYPTLMSVLGALGDITTA